MNQMTVFACLDLVVKLGVFETINMKGESSAKELGDLVGMDSGVIGQYYLSFYFQHILTGIRK